MGQFENDPEFTVLPMKTADYRGILYNFNNPLFRDHRELPNALSLSLIHIFLPGSPAPEI